MFYRKITVSDQKRYWLNIVVFGIEKKKAEFNPPTVLLWLSVLQKARTALWGRVDTFSRKDVAQYK